MQIKTQGKGFIYRISYLNNPKVYIGQCKNIKQRMKQHFAALKNNRHPNIEWQSDYNNNMCDTPIIDVLTEVEYYLLDKAEDYHISTHKGLLYNVGYIKSVFKDRYESTQVYSVCLTPTDHAKLTPNGSHGELSKRIRTLAHVLGHEDTAREYELILEKLKELSK